MSTPFESRCIALLTELALGKPEDVRSITPLTGGVASDIATIDLGDRKICVKFACEQLRVAQEWHAPVHRNKAEYHWLEVAARFVPASGLGLYGHSLKKNGFAMEFLDGSDVYLWKDMCMVPKPDQGQASAVGKVVGQIHQASTRPGFDSTPFKNHDDFHALRLDPYLNFTARAHPDVASVLEGLVGQLQNADQVLLHGDVSPKNVLFRGEQPVILDAECATMGDPCFDLAFCMTMLELDAVHFRETRASLILAARDLWTAYRPFVTWENPDALEARVCVLLPALMLARIDGKSPVAHLPDPVRQKIRDISLPLIANPVTTLEAFSARMMSDLGEF